MRNAQRFFSMNTFLRERERERTEKIPDKNSGAASEFIQGMIAISKWNVFSLSNYCEVSGSIKIFNTGHQPVKTTKLN